MRTAYLHIGLHKTGTSSIQAAFRDFRQGDLWYWPRPGWSNHSVALVTVWRADPMGYALHRRAGRTEAEVAALREEYARALENEFRRGGSTIFSGEGLSAHLGFEDVARAVETLRQHYDEVRAIAYVRPWRSAMASTFQQRLRAASTRSFRPQAQAYHRRLGPWHEVLGPEGLTMRKFDRAALREGDVVADFAAWLGVDATGLPRPEKNVSLSAEAVALLYTFNLAPDLPSDPKVRLPLVNKLVRLLRHFGKARLRFSDRLMEAAAAERADDIRWIEEVAGFSVSDPLPPARGEIVIDSEAELLALARKARRRIARLAKTGDPGPERHRIRRIRRILRQVRAGAGEGAGTADRVHAEGGTT